MSERQLLILTLGISAITLMLSIKSEVNRKMAVIGLDRIQKANKDTSGYLDELAVTVPQALALTGVDVDLSQEATDAEGNSAKAHNLAVSVRTFIDSHNAAGGGGTNSGGGSPNVPEVPPTVPNTSFVTSKESVSGGDSGLTNGLG